MLLLFAHYVPLDPEPGTSTMVLPGPLIATGARACCLDRQSENAFIDVGVEVSAFHFVRGSGSSVLDQLGYGGLVQLSLGGLPVAERNPDDPGLHLRFALGAEGTLGMLGVQAGLVTRAFGPVYGTSLGAFGGGFLSIGIVSIGVQLEQPFVWSDRQAPLLFTVPATFKWPVFEIDDAPSSSSRTSS